MIKTCVDAGVNYFDTAELYADGLMETILGRSLKNLQLKKEDYVISTKFFWKSFNPTSVN